MRRWPRSGTRSGGGEETTQYAQEDFKEIKYRISCKNDWKADG